jgi:hypothetical protein
VVQLEVETSRFTALLGAQRKYVRLAQEGGQAGFVEKSHGEWWAKFTLVLLPDA